MIDYREQKSIESEETSPTVHVLAKVGQVWSDGVTLIFPGHTTPTEKHYARSKDISLSSGDKVLVVKVSGTYVVICRI